MKSSKILAGLMGLCVGDALGVPVEFQTREELEQKPIIDMHGQNCWSELPGTWSDDSSLTFCLADSLCSDFSLEAISTSFCGWYYDRKWTARGKVFDIGITTQMAIEKLRKGSSPLQSGDTVERSNGNGSLMRILPLAYYHQIWNFQMLIDRVHQVSCITHAHPRAQMACGIYISIVIALLEGNTPKVAYRLGLDRIEPAYQRYPYSQEKSNFDRVFSREIERLPVEDINSEGYVIDTLEASLWCFLNTSSYPEAVLKAVNLGEDTDTTAAVTGGLAGIYYGVESIPMEWMIAIARQDDIIALAHRLEIAIDRHTSQSSTR